MGGILAVIPARGGSKRVPRKNLRPLCGRPLLAYTVEAAMKCDVISRTVVSTEDEEIAALALSLGAAVIERPTDLARDETKSEPVIRHAVEQVRRSGERHEDLCLLQPTSPLRTSAHIAGAAREYIAHGRRQTISVSPTSAHLNKLLLVEDGLLRPLFGDAVFRKGGGALGATFLPNGAIYLTRVDSFLAAEDLYGERIVPYLMSETDGIDIDTEDDLQLAEWLMTRRQGA